MFVAPICLIVKIILFSLFLLESSLLVFLQPLKFILTKFNSVYLCVFLFSRTIPSSYSLTMEMQRWCRCGSVAVWRRDELSRRMDASDVLKLSTLEGWTRTFDPKPKGDQDQVCPYALHEWTKITRCSCFMGVILYLQHLCAKEVFFCLD